MGTPVLTCLLSPQNYIARFGHGSAKLARQAQSKEKTLAKMIEKGGGDYMDQARISKLFVVRGSHISCYTTVRGPDTLRNAVVSGYVTFYKSNASFVNILLFSLLIKRLRGPDLAPGLSLEIPGLGHYAEPR